VLAAPEAETAPAVLIPDYGNFGRFEERPAADLDDIRTRHRWLLPRAEFDLPPARERPVGSIGHRRWSRPGMSSCA
jgi:hypothetical protein